MEFPRLKNRFAFRVSAPSFIFPAGYAENVDRLGDHVDEVELLLLESRPEAFPPPAVIAELRRLAGTLHITYNVHLPTDIDPAAPDGAVRLSAVQRIETALALAAPLEATTCTLHLPFGSAHRFHGVAAWQARAVQSLELLVSRSKIAPCRISLETLDYPPQWLTPILAALPCSICLDVGHVLNAGQDLKTVLDELAPRISILHVHGVADGTDHLSLDRLPPAAWATLQPFLAGFRGSVSLEVFSAARLRESMICLNRHMAG